MANNYTQFSTAIEVADPIATKNRLAALFEEASAYMLLPEDSPVPAWCVGFSPEFVKYESHHIEVCLKDDDESPIMNSDKSFLWVHSDTSADFDVLCGLLHELIKLEPDTDTPLRWVVPYANTCDRERIGEFGGGALIITKDGACAWDTESIVNRIEQLLGTDSLKEMLFT